MNTFFTMFVVIAVLITMYQLYVGERNAQYYDETVEVEAEGFFTESILNILFVLAFFIFGVGGILISLGIYTF